MFSLLLFDMQTNNLFLGKLNDSVFLWQLRRLFIGLVILLNFLLLSLIFVVVFVVIIPFVTTYAEGEIWYL